MTSSNENGFSPAAALRPRLVERYLFDEAAKTWTAVTAVLMAIMISTRFARYLGKAADGTIPADLLWKVVLLSSLRYLTILIPISLLLGTMLALGRMYKDSEVSAMQACGLGLGQMYRPFVRLGIWLAVLAGGLSLYVSPLAGRTVDYLTKKAAQDLQFSIVEPGKFRDLPDDAGVFYVESLSDNGRAMDNVFVQLTAGDLPSVITASRGVQRLDPQTGARSLVLLDGYRVDGRAGEANYRIIKFAEHGVTVAPPDFVYRVSQQALKPTADLLGSADLEDIAELQWRLSAPVAVLLMALLAVPLSKTDVRGGRYNKVAVGIVVYILYFNLMGVSAAWLESGKLPPWIGMWWVHAIVALAALQMLAARAGWVQRLRMRYA